MAITPKSPWLGQIHLPWLKEQRGGGFCPDSHCTLCRGPVFPVFTSSAPDPILTCCVESTRRRLAVRHATGFKTAGDWRVLDLQLLFGEWGFYEADTISLAYRVLTIFMAGWDLLEAPSWNVMETRCDFCPVL